MPKLSEVCRHIRSKNAGRFRVTVDLSFRDDAAYRSHRDNIGARTFAERFGAEEALVKVIQVDNLRVVKVSYPRPKSQGWRGERDMHAGQQYVSLLDVEVGPARV